MATAVLRPASVQAEALVQLQPSVLESTSARSLGDLAAGPGPGLSTSAALSFVRRGPKRSPIANLFGSTSASTAPPARPLERDSSEAVLVEPADPIPEPDSLASTPLALSEHSPDSNLNYGMSFLVLSDYTLNMV